MSKTVSDKIFWHQKKNTHVCAQITVHGCVNQVMGPKPVRVTLPFEARRKGMSSKEQYRIQNRKVMFKGLLVAAVCCYSLSSFWKYTWELKQLWNWIVDFLRLLGIQGCRLSATELSQSLQPVWNELQRNVTSAPSLRVFCSRLNTRPFSRSFFCSARDVTVIYRTQ